MGINFLNYEAGSERDGQDLHPRDLFAALPRVRGYEYLRGPQDQILDQWHRRRGARDLIVKLNTGGGKTVVGLLIAQSSLDDGKGPVAYLVPDHYLAEQVRKEAASLGVAVTDDPESYAYSASRAILVDVFQKVVNGMSVFGVRGSVSKPARFGLGTVIIDDAHACLSKAEEQFKVVVPAGTKEYDGLLAEFTDVLDQQSQNALMDLSAGRRHALVPIPYWAWRDRQRRVLEILHPISNTKPHHFHWPLIADVLPLCRAVFTADGLEIAPTHLPIDILTGFAEAQRRVYLTATLADDGILVSDFAADAETIASPVAPANAGDIGDRLIVIPQEIVPDATEEQVRQLVAELAATQNVAVIVPSGPRAAAWSSYDPIVLDKDSIKAGVERLRSGEHVGLVVFVNRYDGVDLPGDACHLLVIDGLPEALTGLERLDESNMSGSDSLLRRQIQRIEQGMGRAVRSNDDYCVVFLMGARLTERLLRPGARQAFSPATRAQMDLSRQVAQDLHGATIEQLLAVVGQVLGRDVGWITASRSRLAKLRYDQAPVDPLTTARREAFDLAVRQRWSDAAAAQQKAIDAARDDKILRGQLLQELAALQHPIDPVLAQETQRAANELNRALLRPATGVSYAKLATPIQEQGAVSSAWMQGAYRSGAELRLGYNALLADLVFGPRTEQFEAALDDLAWHLGFAGQRPERDIGRGPDNLWALNDNSFLVIEAKSGSGEHAVVKQDAKQLSNAMDWFREQYPLATGTPVLVHPWSSFDAKAAVPQRCRVVTTEKLFLLRDAVDQLATALAENDAFRDPARVTKALAYHGLTAQQLLTRYSVEARTGR